MKRRAPLASKGIVAEASQRLRDLDVAPAPGRREHAASISSQDQNSYLPSRLTRFGVLGRQSDRDSSAPTASIVHATDASGKSSRPNLKSSVLTRPWFTWLSGSVICFLSFFVAMQSIKPAKPPSPGIAILAASVVSDPRTLMAAVKAAGLKGTANVRGSIDAIKSCGIRKPFGQRSHATGDTTTIATSEYSIKLSSTVMSGQHDACGGSLPNSLREVQPPRNRLDQAAQQPRYGPLLPRIFGGRNDQIVCLVGGQQTFGGTKYRDRAHRSQSTHLIAVKPMRANELIGQRTRLRAKHCHPLDAGSRAR
jgi:hypothetical protein